MYYAIYNSWYRTNIIIDDNGIIVYPKCFFGKPMVTRDMWYDPEEDAYEEDEAEIKLIDCGTSLKKLRKALFKPWRKYTDYGRLTRALKRGRIRHGEEAVQILRRKREKVTYDSVCKIARELSSVNRRRRGGS